MVCRSCAAELKALREEGRSCPIDGERMEKQVFEFVLLDKCPMCGGVWLDNGELEIIRETVRNRATPIGVIWDLMAGLF